MLLFLPNTKLLLHTRQFLSYKIDINTITDKEKKWPTNNARILMQALELRVSVWTSFQKWKENQPESSLPCISWKAKPQPFPLKFCFWENEIFKNNSCPLMRQSQTRVMATTCKHGNSCSNFPALKTKSPLNTKFLCLLPEINKKQLTSPDFSLPS